MPRRQHFTQVQRSKIIQHIFLGHILYVKMVYVTLYGQKVCPSGSCYSSVGGVNEEEIRNGINL